VPNNIHSPPIINLDEFLLTPTHGNIGVKRKCNFVFSFVIESTNKNNKILMDAMEKINVTQLEIE